MCWGLGRGAGGSGNALYGREHLGEAEVQSIGIGYGRVRDLLLGGLPVDGQHLNDHGHWPLAQCRPAKMPARPALSGRFKRWRK
ncbi:MAG: hypothetical protein EOO61_21140 [Hymenobacter sp.]|nr:MAG: hypothetical protein EOO61_21140 [Hymenobacter sp.]